MSHCCSCHGSAVASKATQILKDEHRVIEGVLDSVEKMLQSDRIDKGFFTNALDFFRNFADGCHHHKEEDELFPVLEAAGVPNDGGPIGCMLSEHEQGRRLLKRVSENLDGAAAAEPVAVAAVRTAATDYISMLRFHIQKEDNVLFNLADQMLTEAQQKAMIEAFDRAEQHDGDPGKHERYLKLADSLRKQAFGVG